MPKMTHEQRVNAVKGVAALLVDQHFDQVTESIAPGVRALAGTQSPELRGPLVEAMFDAIVGKLQDAKAALVAEVAPPVASVNPASERGIAWRDADRLRSTS